jgi:hypothetical protein
MLIHTPKRLGVPLDARAHALPDFGSEEGWYLHVGCFGIKVQRSYIEDSLMQLNLNAYTWLERFLEFGRQT